MKTTGKIIFTSWILLVVDCMFGYTFSLSGFDLGCKLAAIILCVLLPILVLSVIKAIWSDL